MVHVLHYSHLAQTLLSLVDAEAELITVMSGLAPINVWIARVNPVSNEHSARGESAMR